MVTVDPHSAVMPALVNRLTIAPLSLVVPPMIRFKGKTMVKGIIAPDAGAVKRAEEFAAAIGFTGDIVQVTKRRDPQTGKLSGFAYHGPKLDPNADYLIVDDICDGGGTFKGVATATGLPPHALSLWVTHGIFSRGASDLSDYIGRMIYSTDSHPGWSEFDPINLIRIPIFPALHNYLWR